ncbi:MAG: DUF4097 domain-containing protein [Chloroflexi bacterium]|nr:DUF4097 domain-containing protein [Chloroflexota bacterium]
MNLDRRLLGWGLLFIILGGVPLLARAGLLSDDLIGRWPTLWPLFLIAWGLGMILARTPLGWLGGAVFVVTLGLMGGGAITTGFGGFSSFSGCGDGEGGTAFATQSGTLGAEGRVNIEFSCGDLAVTAADGSGWSVSGTDRDGRGPDVATSGDQVTIRSRERDGFFNPLQGSSAWNVSLPRDPALSLGVTLNAGEGTLDLAGATLTSMNFTVNAGSLDIGLATADQLASVNGTVNAGSAVVNLPGGDLSLNLSLNAGSIDVCLPAGAAARVQWSGALGSNDLDEAGLDMVDDDTWQTPGFNAAQPHAALNVSANAGSFGLQFGGTCGA